MDNSTRPAKGEIANTARSLTVGDVSMLKYLASRKGQPSSIHSSFIELGFQQNAGPLAQRCMEILHNLKKWDLVQLVVTKKNDADPPTHKAQDAFIAVPGSGIGLFQFVPKNGTHILITQKGEAVLGARFEMERDLEESLIKTFRDYKI